MGVARQGHSSPFNAAKRSLENRDVMVLSTAASSSNHCSGESSPNQKSNTPLASSMTTCVLSISTPTTRPKQQN